MIVLHTYLFGLLVYSKHQFLFTAVKSNSRLENEYLPTTFLDTLLFSGFAKKVSFII
jgi:hypothetical protein